MLLWEFVEKIVIIKWKYHNIKHPKNRLHFLKAKCNVLINSFDLGVEYISLDIRSSSLLHAKKFVTSCGVFLCGVDFFWYIIYTPNYVTCFCMLAAPAFFKGRVLRDFLSCSLALFWSRKVLLSRLHSTVSLTPRPAASHTSAHTPECLPVI